MHLLCIQVFSCVRQVTRSRKLMVTQSLSLDIFVLIKGFALIESKSSEMELNAGQTSLGNIYIPAIKQAKTAQEGKNLFMFDPTPKYSLILQISAIFGI